MKMPAVFDAARYILQKKGCMPAWKLHKLIYYSQAWSLVWDEHPLFDEPIEAWENGPVVPKLFAMHKGLFMICPDDIPGDVEALTPSQKETLDAVVRDYGGYTSQYLSDLTHTEDPWKLARSPRPGIVPPNAIIPLDTMARYYESLPPAE